jgi:myo-inositol 2-dehydrogenase / D-chiro-inositol 1-dehydrogenase
MQSLPFVGAQPVRLGLAGLGRIGRLHADNIRRIPSAELVRIVDVSESTARGVGEAVGVEWSTAYDDLLADADVDAIILATPTALHVPMIEGAARAGKHIFCEKPISLDLEGSTRAVELARSARIKLQVGFHRRYDPDWRTATERIQSGELGDVYLFRTSLRDMRPPSIEYLRGSGGLFIDATIHDLDAARWMVGEVDEVTAIGAALSGPAFAETGDVDNAIVTLRFAGGALGAIDNSRVAGYGYECSTEVVGSKATVRIAHHRRVNNEWLTPGSVSTDWVADFAERYAQAYLLELEDFAAAVSEDRDCAVTGEDALSAFVLAQACERSFRKSRPVRLRREKTETGVTYELAEAA